MVYTIPEALEPLHRVDGAPRGPDGAHAINRRVSQMERESRGYEVGNGGRLSDDDDIVPARGLGDGTFNLGDILLVILSLMGEDD